MKTLNIYLPNFEMKILDILKSDLTQESGPQTLQLPRVIHQLKSDRF